KLKTTYVDILPTLTNRKTGRVHTTFSQTSAATGRLSSMNPNLQNIPAGSGFGREVRKAFIAAPEFQLVSFDYSQIELRVAAHLADDAGMIDAFKKGEDIHKTTAAAVYHILPEHVTSEQRRAAKTLNFGVLYGMGPRAFAAATGLSRAEAEQFIEQYFQKFAGILIYLAHTKAFALEHGYVETLYGRRRAIPEIASANWQIRREAERMAINHPIQGSATGDIIKRAMIRIDKEITDHKLNRYVRMLLQVHDELIFEIAKDAFQKVIPRIRDAMEHIVTLKVPLVVDVKVGQNWGEQYTFL
ncbi:MAG: DNA polymerase I, partial [Parcubacteria group bacterium Gr01-1014_66]